MTALPKQSEEYDDSEFDPGKLLEDPKHFRGDCQMISRAVRERWPISDKKRESLVDRLMEMTNDSAKERHVLSAVRALLAMDRDNVKAGTQPQPIAAQQTNISVNIGTNPIDQLHAAIEASEPIMPIGMSEDAADD